ncbi:MAG: glycosyltransferase family 4 protein [Motiliproteus sp.]
MSDYKKSLVILTNLYPLPWEPNRAVFNHQQFQLLQDEYDLSILIPVAFGEWFKNRNQIKQTAHTRYVPYFYLPKFGRRFYSWFMLFSILLHSGFWLKRRQPELILASWAYPEGVAGAWLSRLLRVRFFFKVHGSDVNIHGRVPARAKQIRWASEQATGILSVSKALAAELKKIGVNGHKIHTIYNGVDHNKFGSGSGSEELPSYVLFVGNLKREKGVLELLEGFAAITSSYPDLHLVYAGGGVMAEQLKNQAQEFGIADRVKLLGNVDHDCLPPLMRSARALVLPSYNEGVPNVVLEAMACGTPVLATRVGGIPEVMEEGVSGLLIKEKDSAEVARGLGELLDKTWDSKKIQQHASQFSWEINKQQLLNMLNG